MAEGIVNLVLNKLAEAVLKEAQFLNGAGGKLDSLQHELRWIRAFLKDAESKSNSDERIKVWVSDVREVAYRIEDVVDMFMSEVEDRMSQPGMVRTVKVSREF
ncbi:CC-NBS-LRR class disease resistance protein [Rhynchospora pubera]|uniref:CC-NBS-LRR class disease resistance protein n=1 Tax=Rhynchospora pubera TaxID=906938 RepID=A0AAV8DPS0_9POAL|nr:CC-NBS-LRR class disease resistance protein [Rhynchospora pubera]